MTEVLDKNAFETMLRNESELYLTLAVLDCVNREKREWIAEVFDWFDAKYIVTPFLREVCRGLVSLFAAGTPPTSLEIARTLHSAKTQHRASLTWIAKLGEWSAAQAGHVRYYAKVVYDEYRKMNASSELHGTATELAQSHDVDQVLEEIREFPDRFMPPPDDRADENTKAIAEVMRMIEGSVDAASISIGLPTLDNAMKIGRTSLTTVGAVTSGGKSVLLSQIAMHVAATDGKAVLFFTFEMSASEVFMRMGCNWARQDIDGDKHRLIGGASHVHDLVENKKLLHLFTRSCSSAEIRRKVETFAAQMDVALVCVDYIQQVAPNRRYDRREQEVAETSRSLKLIAQDLRIPVIAACQLNDLEGDNMPSMRSFRESKAIGMDSDNVLFLHQSKPEEEPERLTIRIAKNRNGQKRLCYFEWDKPCFRIDELPEPVSVPLTGDVLP